MRTAVVILNWNTRDFLREYLPRVLEDCGCGPDGSAAAGAEVIVADNGSTDGSVEYLRKAFPALGVIALDKNYGFTGGYDKALATLKGYDCFVLLNSDVQTTPGWLGPLEEWMEANPDCGACAPKILSLADKSKFEYAGAAGGYLDAYGYPFCRGRVLDKIDSDRGQFDASPKDVFWVSGACMMVRCSAFDSLDERFFAHFEEIDLCWRMQLHGYRVTAVPSSAIYHLGGGTLPNNSPGKLYLNYRNNLLMLSNNLAMTYALSLYKAGADAATASRKASRRASFRIFERMVLDGFSALAYLLKGKWSWMKAVWKAHRDYRKLRRSPSPGEIAPWLETFGEKACVRGIYDKWIVPRALLRGGAALEIAERL